MKSYAFRGVVLSVAALLILSLSGCTNSASVTAKRDEVERYNETVKQTISAYNACISFASDNRQSLMDIVFRNRYVPALYEERLSSMDLENILEDMILQDRFYTAYGATGAREIIQFGGYGERLYLTIIWGAENIIDIERQVVKL